METETVLVLFMAALMDSQGVSDFQDDYLPSTALQNQDRPHCSYPCQCAPLPRCPAGVSVVKDGCGCCPLCARQAGQPCDGSALCDESRGLICQYPSAASTVGTCKAIKGRPCTIYNQTYDNGETFMLDCRTQCACKNGTYACASLCPQENISPRGSCSHPRLVDVPGQCCREWLCDPASVQRPPQCRSNVSQWTSCSSTCGLGLSHRISNLNSECRPRNETRLCQLRPCSAQLIRPSSKRIHHIRKGHECKATQRLGFMVSLVFGQCHSRRLYRPRACGGGCLPELSSTARVEFVCGATAGLVDAELGSDLWRVVAPAVEGRVHTLSVDVQWVLKCHCGAKCSSEVTAVPLYTQFLHRVHRST